MNGIIIGVFYIVATVSAVIAVISYQPVLSDQWYLAVENGFETKILLGVLNDLLLVVSAVGTAVMLFPYIRKWNEHLASRISLFSIYGGCIYCNRFGEYIRVNQSEYAL